MTLTPNQVGVLRGLEHGPQFLLISSQQSSFSQLTSKQAVVIIEDDKRVISSNRAVCWLVTILVPIYPCMPQHNRRVGARELAGWSVGLQIDTVTDHSLMVCVTHLESMAFAPCCQ